MAPDTSINIASNADAGNDRNAAKDPNAAKATNDSNAYGLFLSSLS